MVRNEEEFYQDLNNIFIGAKVEGNSGFVNLMKIKSTYLEKILKSLKSNIDAEISEFPELKDELFTRLHTFFKTYFSESGSIYFSYTPLRSKVYEKIYTNNQDVILFWKTNMLYYVKTDNIYKSLSIGYEIEGSEYTIKFDASQIEGKRFNEKRILIFELDNVNNKTITFKPQFSEHGKKTKISENLKELHKSHINITEEQLDELFKTFKKQTEVDYFINKDAKAFLREQFDLWLKNYIFDDESDYSEKRLKQLKILKNIAYKVIDFVAQFEDELVKIWNKPKFALNSNYVITLDRIASKQGGVEVIKGVLDHKEIEEQIKEWKDLGIVESNFEKKSVLNGEVLNEKYSFLPIDTKYFKNLELEILGLFDNLDKSLDGWLIKSENYQALNTILPKFKEKVQTIYMDPPYNTGEDFDYIDMFQDSSWLTLMSNRLEKAKEYLNNKSSLFVSLDWNANYYGRIILNNLFDISSEIVWNTNATKDEEAGLFSYKSFGNKSVRQHDTIFHCIVDDNFKFLKLWKPNRDTTKLIIRWLDLISKPRDSKHQKIEDYDYFIEKYNDRGDLILEKIDIKEKIFPIGDVWNDIYSFMQSELRVSESLGFKTQKPENLLRRIIQSSSEINDLVMDFFAGSGTTLAVAHKLRRKWLGVEMADYFNEFWFDEDKKKVGILGRMKIVVSGDQKFIVVDKSRGSHLSKDINYQGGGFFKYYELEQYEQTLRKCHYIPSDPFFDLNDKSIYEQYIFLKDPKLLDAMELDYKNNKININFDVIYSNIDLAETLSNIKGKFIKRIEKDSVVFEGDEKVKFSEIEFETIKPLIRW